MLKEFDWRGELAKLHTSFSANPRKPIVGITGNFGEKGCELAEGYYRSVLEAGAIPMVIPPYDDREALLGVLDGIDALLLSGGGDMNPLFVGEDPLPSLHGINPHRDLPELLLIRLAYDRQIPMMGICRGAQMLAAALGGRVYQDLAQERSGEPLLKHDQNLPREYASHSVCLEEDSLLFSLMRQTELAVNSFHHQAIENPGPKLRVSARSKDGVIEAVESTEYKSIIGVQWHPECFIVRNERSMMPLFEWLIAEAINYRKARNIHQHTLTIDSHCDTPMCFNGDVTPSQLFSQRTDKVLVDLHKMREGGLDASVMVAYLPQGVRDAKTHSEVTRKTHQILDQIEEMVQNNAEYVAIARTAEELYALKAEGKRAIMLGVENGYAIGRDLLQIKALRERGVVYMTLCHNGDNDICDSARGTNEHGGISDFGIQVVSKMNECGMMIDLSHASEKSFYDALSFSKVPIVCSHSSSRALCDHPRNLSDDQLRALAKAGGVAQVTFYHGFLQKEGEASVLDAVRHLNHMVRVMGIEHVGIGSDFDGDGGVAGLADASEMLNFTRHLLRERYSENDLRLIWGGNFLRVMGEVQSYM